MSFFSLTSCTVPARMAIIVFSDFFFCLWSTHAHKRRGDTRRNVRSPAPSTSGMVYRACSTGDAGARRRWQASVWAMACCAS